jgi:hypothetical protein
VSIKEKVMGWIKTAAQAVENSNNVKSQTYPDNRDTYQDYRTPEKKEDKK